jgi:hypothetical protein
MNKMKKSMILQQLAPKKAIVDNDNGNKIVLLANKAFGRKHSGLQIDLQQCGDSKNSSKH